MGVSHGFEKNETATMFFLKKPSLVNYIFGVEWKDDIRFKAVVEPASGVTYYTIHHEKY